MKTRKKGYWFLFVLTIFFVIMAISTIIPSESVNKVSMLGYKAHCSYAPISTIICLALAGLSCLIRKRRFVEVK